MSKKFEVEIIDGKYELFSDGWFLRTDEAGCKREFGKWVERITEA